ncbi:MAG: ABC transporter ATP-binding protein, partial [Actinomycetes bacterium]
MSFLTTRGDFTLQVDTVFEGGSVVAILGPNGAGKSTLVRVIAGLQPISRGIIRIGGVLVDDAGGVFIPPQHRSVGVVFQDYALFPHLSVLENVAFGPRSRGSNRAESRSRARDVLNSLGVGDLQARRPKSISGGQAQRVALARALAARPDVLILDEPMAALDVETKASVRVELETQLSAFGGCAIIVTHDPLDAMLLADRVVVIELGAIVQDGSPVELAQRPRSAYVAALLGVTLLRGEALEGELT